MSYGLDIINSDGHRVFSGEERALIPVARGIVSTDDSTWNSGEFTVDTGVSTSSYPDYPLILTRNAFGYALLRAENNTWVFRIYPDGLGTTEWLVVVPFHNNTPESYGISIMNANGDIAYSTYADTKLIKVRQVVPNILGTTNPLVSNLPTPTYNYWTNNPLIAIGFVPASGGIGVAQLLLYFPYYEEVENRLILRPISLGPTGSNIMGFYSFRESFSFIFVEYD